MDNAEISSIVKILGLKFGKKYESEDDVKTLRYGRVMIMSDQDHDGSHIKGLLINFIHHHWPEMLRRRCAFRKINPVAVDSLSAVSHQYLLYHSWLAWLISLIETQSFH